jgi:hypothetical protein
MFRLLRIAVPLALLAVALSLVACGSDNARVVRNAYVQQVNSAQTEFANTVTTVSKQITAKSSSSQDRKTLQRFERAIQEVVKKLKGITPPSNVKTEHQALVTAMSTFGRQIKKASSALRNPDTTAIAGAQRTIQTATETVNASINNAIAAINSKLTAK